jgi:hypothetical protein
MEKIKKIFFNFFQIPNNICKEKNIVGINGNMCVYTWNSMGNVFRKTLRTIFFKVVKIRKIGWGGVEVDQKLKK